MRRQLGDEQADRGGAGQIEAADQRHPIEVARHRRRQRAELLAGPVDGERVQRVGSVRWRRFGDVRG